MGEQIQSVFDSLQQLEQHVAAVLGGPVAGLSLTWQMETTIVKSSARPRSVPLANCPLIRWVSQDQQAQEAYVGADLYRLRIGSRTVPLVHTRFQLGTVAGNLVDDLWFTPKAELAAVYRFLRRKERLSSRARPPLMADAVRDRLWRNTVGFLQRGPEVLSRYGMTLKRGVMLLGPPGNGKTMAARWLRYEALRRNLSWKTVTVQEYEQARGQGDLHELFELERPGFVFLDDFDAGLQDREEVGRSFEHSVLLTELDGLDLAHGVVFLFTTNLKERDLDPAIRRPGRIDLFVDFAGPTAELRERLIREYWPAEMQPHLPVEAMVTATDGLSFAELDELKKLLVLHHLDTERWDWPHAWQEYQSRRTDNSTRRTIGFAGRAPFEERPHTPAVLHVTAGQGQ